MGRGAWIPVAGASARRVAGVSLLLIACGVGIAHAGCAPAVATGHGSIPEWPTVQRDGSLILVSGGFGYEPADVVLVDVDRLPQPGDVIQYDARVNLSDCHAFGPGQYLARVAAGPGSIVRFEECMFVAGCYLGAIQCGPDLFPRTRNVCWGEDWYEDIAGMSLVVPGDEYLAHGWIGQECRQVGGESLAGSRFTVKSAAVIGVIVKKLGHDDRVQRYLEGIRY